MTPEEGEYYITLAVLHGASFWHAHDAYPVPDEWYAFDPGTSERTTFTQKNFPDRSPGKDPVFCVHAPTRGEAAYKYCVKHKLIPSEVTPC